MSVRLSLPAPAKLNLFLHILGRRDDGYHELQTLFQFLDHGDELHFEARQDGQVRLHTEIAGVPHDSNLIVRAARGCRKPPAARKAPTSGWTSACPWGRHRRRQLRRRHDAPGLEPSLATRLGRGPRRRPGPAPGRRRAGLHPRTRSFRRGRGRKAHPGGHPGALVSRRGSASTCQHSRNFSDPLLTRDSPAIKVRTVLEGDSRNDCQPVVEGVTQKFVTL